MNPAAYDIAVLLEGAGLGYTMTKNLFVSKMPDSPDEVAVCYDTPSRPPQMFYRKPDKNIVSGTVAIQVRGLEYPTTWQKAYDVMTYFHNTEKAETNSALYMGIRAQSEPVSLGWDDNDRIVLVVRLDFHRRAS